MFLTAIASRRNRCVRQHELYFVAFDLLHHNGHDLRDMALEERREILASMIEPGGRVQVQRAAAGEQGHLSPCRPGWA
ncbi:hypothetical protein [Mesorhizobium sp. M1406]|uniref:ATP-dependent DNA ligase n=1 Tax=Mesorhizobium sp. M1406 TaxID=2957099 RepID=UPI003338A3D2